MYIHCVLAGRVYYLDVQIAHLISNILMRLCWCVLYTRTLALTMEDDQYIVDTESRYTPFSDIAARNYYSETCGYNRATSDYNVDAMRVPYAQPVRTAESKFMAGQMGMPAYVLNYQCGVNGDGVANGMLAGVPYGASVDKTIIPRVYAGADPRDYGWNMGNPGDALSVGPNGNMGNTAAGTREYYPRAMVIDSHSPMPGRVPDQPLMPASQQGKTQWPWPMEKCSGGRDGLTITLDPNMLMLFMFIIVVSMCYLGMQMMRKIEKISTALGIKGGWGSSVVQGIGTGDLVTDLTIPMVI